MEKSGRNTPYEQSPFSGPHEASSRSVEEARAQGYRERRAEPCQAWDFRSPLGTPGGSPRGGTPGAVQAWQTLLRSTTCEVRFSELLLAR